MAKKKNEEVVVDELEQATEQEPEAAEEEVVVDTKPEPQAKPQPQKRYVLTEDYEGYIGRNVSIKAGEAVRGSILRQLQAEKHPMKEVSA